ncbi:MAG: GatB/YqeY domain-containing protein [Alphaproteobacteria bacterium]
MSENLLRDDLAAALKAAIGQDEQRTVAIIRLVQAALKERDEQSREDGGRLHITDAELMSMLTTMVDQRQESMRRYEETGQLELAEGEAEDIEILRRFLPPQLDAETQEVAIAQVIAELGASKLKDIGRVMTELKSRYPGQMNFAAVRRRLCDHLA